MPSTLENVRDGTGWLVALVASRFMNAPRYLELATSAERAGFAFHVVVYVAFLWVAALGWPILWWFAPFLLLGWVLADLVVLGDRAAERQKTLRLLTEKPSGAPRVAHIRCANGATHTFLYGPYGWTETKPEQVQEPDPVEV